MTDDGRTWVGVPRLIQDYAEAYLAMHDKDWFFQGYRPFSYRQKWDKMTEEETRTEIDRIKRALVERYGAE
jgi:hypothetical protein